jgi:hypothetical protein
MRLRSCPGAAVCSHGKLRSGDADRIVRHRCDFIDELGTRLEREGEISGERVDALWREFYVLPALRAQFGSRGVNY